MQQDSTFSPSVNKNIAIVNLDLWAGKKEESNKNLPGEKSQRQKSTLCVVIPVNQDESPAN